MAKVPFQREIQDLFESDRSILLKLLGGAGVGGFLALRAVMKDNAGGNPAFSTTVKTVILIGGAVCGALVVLLLTLRDVVLRRVDQGRPVNLLLRSYFNRGNGCLMVFLWFLTVVVATIIVTMLTANL